MKTLLEPIVADALLKVTAWAGHLLKSHQIDAPLMCAQFEKKLKLLTRALATSNSMIKPGAKAYSLGFDDAAATSLSPAQILLETHAACERLLKTLKAFPEFNSILPWADLRPMLVTAELDKPRAPSSVLRYLKAHEAFEQAGIPQSQAGRQAVLQMHQRKGGLPEGCAQFWAKKSPIDKQDFMLQTAARYETQDQDSKDTEIRRAAGHNNYEFVNFHTHAQNNNLYDVAAFIDRLANPEPEPDGWLVRDSHVVVNHPLAAASGGCGGDSVTLSPPPVPKAASGPEI